MRLTLCFCLGLTACSTVGVEGPPGPQGEQGLAGPQGPPLGVVGDRLTPLCHAGTDGSCVPSDWAKDERTDPKTGEVVVELCHYQEVGDQEPSKERCIPPFAESTDWYHWSGPTCAGDKAYVDSHNGLRLVRIMSSDPSTHHHFYRRTEEVLDQLWWKGVANNEACHLDEEENTDDWVWYRWAEVSPAEFVEGTLVPM